jgi:cell wall-associated NlpC family hydrolase
LHDPLQRKAIARAAGTVAGRLAFRSRRPQALIVLLGLGLVAVGPSPLASGQAGIDGQRRAADQLRGAVAAENARLQATRGGLADAEQRLTSLVARAQAREARLADAQHRLISARIHLSRLQRHEALAKRTLATDLVAQYKAGQPQLMNVVLNSTRFSDLYQHLEFYRRLSKHTAQILDDTRDARADVAEETQSLQQLWGRYSKLAQAAVEDRARADAVRNALLVRERSQLARRDSAAARLASVRTRIARLERRQAAAARAAAASNGAITEAPAAGGGGIVARVVAAANQIASTPYVWGGGHGGASGGYDCSGSISYALAAAGLLSGALDSTGFMSWGEPGPGAHITVYANAGHAFMIVDGRRFDTSALSGGGTRWTSASRSTAGFVARHPPGL